MPRLASIERAGYYPSPPAITAQLASYFHAPHGGRILDPCAGEGEALATLAKQLNLEPYGNELHSGRAVTLTDALQPLMVRDQLKHHDPHPKRAIRGDVQQLELSASSVQLLYLNPPYDFDQDDGRTEFTFLRLATRWLQPEGWLVYVVPQHVLGRKQIAIQLAADYEPPLQIYRFPDGEYERFKQVVVIGRKRRKRQTADETQLNKIHHAATAGTAVPELITAEAPFLEIPAPTVKANKFYFRTHLISLADAQAESQALGIETTTNWQSHLTPSLANSLAGFRPLMPLKKGHLASLIAAGFINNYLLTHPDSGERLMVRGASHKAIYESKRREVLNEAGDYKEITSQREYTKTVITTLSAEGELRQIEGKEMEAFLLKWSGQLAQVVADNHPPVYQMALGEYAERIGNRGTLFPVQKHVAAAVAQRLKSHPDAYILGAMGTGKTRTGGVVPAVLTEVGVRRTLILCPPHLYKKWMREMALVYPEAHIMFLNTIADVDRWMSLDEKQQPQVGVMKFTSARSASGWEHAYDWWHLIDEKEEKLIRDNRKRARQGKPLKPYPESLTRLTASGRMKQEYYDPWQMLMAERGVRCPSCGEPLLNPHGQFLIPKDFKRQQVSCPACSRKQKKYADEHYGRPRRHYGALFRYKRGRNKEGSFREYVAREQAIRHGYEPFYEPSSGGRWRLADYIKKRYKHRIGLLIVDEVHQLKASDSDQGLALARLITASKKVLCLTGTLYGGRSSSIFHLLYRTSPDVRRVYTDEQASGRRRILERQWVKDYGLLETIEKREYDGVTGKQNGNKRSDTTVREAPGSMPQMLKWILNRCAFMSLQDMGFALPSYEEIPVMIEPTAAQLNQKKLLEAKLGSEMRERLAKGDRSLLGAYLQASLCMPDAPWRDEVVVDPKTKEHEKPRIVAEIAGAKEQVGLWPKEEAIVDLCKQEIAAGRRVLLLCQQTGTRDITPRWMEILTDAGLKPVTMKVDASRREAWINEQTKLGKNVLIAHPKAVEVGLDLLAYPTIIFSGIEYSVYTILQASKRAYRIGQKWPCKVYFFVYEQTLQAKALELIVRKMAAALRVNGDVIATNSLAEMDSSGSIEDALGKLIVADGLNGNRVGDLQAQFAAANEAVSHGQEMIGEFAIIEPDLPEFEEPLLNELTPVILPLLEHITHIRDPYKARQLFNSFGRDENQELQQAFAAQHTDLEPTPDLLRDAWHLIKSALLSDSVRYGNRSKDWPDHSARARFIRLVQYANSGQGQWADLLHKVETIAPPTPIAQEQLTAMTDLAHKNKDVSATPTDKLLPATLNIPPIRSQANSSADETVIYAKLFMGSWTWLIAEYDPAEQEAFGYAYDASFPDGAEWGYISIAELSELFQDLPLKDVATGREMVMSKAICVERDKWWEPCLFAEAKRKECFWPWDEEEAVEPSQPAELEPVLPKPPVASAYLDPDLLDDEAMEDVPEPIADLSPPQTSSTPAFTMSQWQEGLQQRLSKLATQPSGLGRDGIWGWLESFDQRWLASAEMDMVVQTKMTVENCAMRLGDPLTAIWQPLHECWQALLQAAKLASEPTEPPAEEPIPEPPQPKRRRRVIGEKPQKKATKQPLPDPVPEREPDSVPTPEAPKVKPRLVFGKPPADLVVVPKGKGRKVIQGSLF